MSTIDTYETLKNLVSSGQGNSSLFLENRKSLFDDFSAYFYLHDNKEPSFRRTDREINIDERQEKGLTSLLCGEGHLVFTIRPERLRNLSLKEMRFILLLNLESYNSMEMSLRIKKGKNPSEDEEPKEIENTLYYYSQNIATALSKNQKNHYRYDKVSEKKGDLFERVEDYLEQKSQQGTGDSTVLSAFSIGKIQEKDGKLDKIAIYNFANRILGKSESFERGLISWGAIKKLMSPTPTFPKWVKILTHFSIGRTCEVKKTKTRLNRLQPQRFDLSGEIKERRPEIVCAIDTSGSRYAERIQKALGQVLALKVKFNYSITLIECDAKIQKITEIKKKGDIPDEYHGRGGTSYCPVIEYINSHPRYRNALLIYFTDGYGDGEIPKPKVRQTVWVLTAGDYLSLKKPYGDVVLIDGDKTINRRR